MPSPLLPGGPREPRTRAGQPHAGPGDTNGAGSQRTSRYPAATTTPSLDAIAYTAQAPRISISHLLINGIADRRTAPSTTPGDRAALSELPGGDRSRTRPAPSPPGTASKPRSGNIN